MLSQYSVASASNSRLDGVDRGHVTALLALFRLFGVIGLAAFLLARA